MLRIICSILAVLMILFHCLAYSQQETAVAESSTAALPDSSAEYSKDKAEPGDYYLNLLMAMPEERFLVRLHNGKKYKGKIVAVRDSIITLDLEKSKSNQQEQAPTLGFLLDDIESIQVAPKRNGGFYLGFSFLIVSFLFVMSRANK